jgi:hypothetical protein
MDQHFQPRIVLQTVAGATVEVIASASSAVDPTDVKTASNYDANRIDTLPTGRGIDAMAALTPGVVTSSSVGGRLQVRGAMTSGNLYLVDGQNLMDQAYNNLQYPIISDSLEETQVITGAISAEYGNVDGGVINTLTKAGGNEFSGQIRVDMSNPAWNALRPYQTAPDNVLSETRNYTLGGYILKDRLWFYVSYNSSGGANAGSIGGIKRPATGENIGAGAGYTDSFYDYRRNFKLTYLINQDHTIIGTYNNSDSGNTHRNYSSGDLNALVPQFNEFMYWNIAWRATWSPTFTTDIRFGHKESAYSAGGSAERGAPIYNYSGDLDADAAGGSGLYYDNGIFNMNDGGDKREADTLNLKGSYFFNASGSHELDFGIDYYKGTRTARNEQSPAVYLSDGSGKLVEGRSYNIIHGVEGYKYDGVTPMAIGADIWNMWGGDGSSEEVTYGIYVNDKWKVNNNIAVLIGVRWDNYETKAGDTGSIASASGFSPRLGVTYDLFGDQKWIFKASYCRYNSAVLQNIATASSLVGKAASIEWAYIGPTGWQPLSVIRDRNNYDPANVTYYEDPSLNITVNPNMKAPYVDEMQLSATYSFATENYGRGYVTLTGVKKTWSQLMDYRIGWNGTINPTEIGVDYDDLLYIQHWDNEPDAERDYEALELSVAYQWGNFNLTGNITWSSLQGNYEGESSNSPGTGQGLHLMDRWRDNNGNWTEGYDYTTRYPYGYLQGHVPIVMRFQADYTLDSTAGKTVFGFAYRFDSGYHYSIVRLVNAYNVVPAFAIWSGGSPGVGSPVAWSAEGIAFGARSGWTQYKDGQRRTEAFNAQVYHDLSITHEFNLFKVYNYQVRAFAKLLILNFFNHQQLVQWDTTHLNGANLEAPWVKGPTFGTSTTAGQFGAARSYSVSLGVRF